jgi:hypothetical protein
MVQMVCPHTSPWHAAVAAGLHGKETQVEAGDGKDGREGELHLGKRMQVIAAFEEAEGEAASQLLFKVFFCPEADAYHGRRDTGDGVVVGYIARRA